MQENRSACTVEDLARVLPWDETGGRLSLPSLCLERVDGYRIRAFQWLMSNKRAERKALRSEADHVLRVHQICCVYAVIDGPHTADTSERYNRFLDQIDSMQEYDPALRLVTYGESPTEIREARFWEACVLLLGFMELGPEHYTSVVAYVEALKERWPEVPARRLVAELSGRLQRRRPTIRHPSFGLRDGRSRAKLPPR